MVARLFQAVVWDCKMVARDIRVVFMLFLQCSKRLSGRFYMVAREFWVVLMFLKYLVATVF